MFWSFETTKKEHLPKPFFKVIRKSLYLYFGVASMKRKFRLRIFRRRPHVSGYLWRQIFFPVLVFRPHINSFFGHQKRKLSKTVPRAEIFWERPLIFVSTYENEGFWIRWCHPSYSVYPETDVIVFVLFKRFCVDCQKGFECATCERAFFRKQRKNHPSSKKV